MKKNYLCKKTTNFAFFICYLIVLLSWGCTSDEKLVTSDNALYLELSAEEDFYLQTMK
jgi:hypothetical protein